MDPARHAGKSYRPSGPELLGAEDMAKAIGRAVGRSVRVVPTPTWLFMKAARMGRMPIDLMSNVRYYVDDHKLGAFELGAPTTDVLDVTGSPAEDFETIARRYAVQPGNQRTPGNWVRQFAQFMIAPFSPGFNLGRYDRELRPLFPSAPQLALESKVWGREHAIPNTRQALAPGSDNPQSPPPVAVNGWNSKNGDLYHATTNDLVFREHRIQLHRVGDSHRSIHLAGTPPPATSRSLAASADPAQLPLHRTGIPGSRRRVTRSANCLRAFRCLRGHHCGDTGDAFTAIAAHRAGAAAAWISTLWGSADILNAFYQANHAGLLAGQLGAAFFLPTVIVPLLLITHGLAFRILLQHQAKPAMQESQHLA